MTERVQGCVQTNICFDCQNATGKCSWSRNFTPVQGWYAELSVLGNEHPIVTYHVMECQLFVRDKPRKHTNGMLTEKRNIEWLERKEWKRYD